MSFLYECTDSNQSWDHQNSQQSQGFSGSFVSSYNHSQASSQEVVKRKQGNDDHDDPVKLAGVVEYEWPKNSGNHFFIEDRLAAYLEIKTMRRSFPKVHRRRIQNYDEKQFLVNNGFLTETQCMLGMIAISAKDVYQLIAPSFPKKMGIYRMTKSKMMYQKVALDACKSHKTAFDEFQRSGAQLRKEALMKCSTWNTRVNKDARKLRQANLNGKIRTIPRQRVPDSADGDSETFPFSNGIGVAKRYTSEVLKCLPLNTCIRSFEPAPSPVTLITDNLKSEPEPVKEIKSKKIARKRKVFPKPIVVITRLEVNENGKLKASAPLINTTPTPAPSVLNSEADNESSRRTLFEEVVVNKQTTKQ